jgi:hypothetical protein
MQVPVQCLLECPKCYPNPADKLDKDIPCDVCKAGGNVQQPRQYIFEDIPDDKIPMRNADGVYMWDFPTPRRSKRCPLCRLIWRTFQLYYEALKPNHSDAMVGKIKGAKPSNEEKLISLICMIACNTIDNHDIDRLGRVYIYEDERVPEYGIYAMASQSASSNSDWRLSNKVDADSIHFFFFFLQWITTCKSEHGSKCPETPGQDVPG